MDNSRVYRSIENNFMSRKKLYSILESKLERSVYTNTNKSIKNSFNNIFLITQ